MPREKKKANTAHYIAQYKFKPGQSGNPKGRPKKIPNLEKLLAEVLGEEKNGVTAIEAILKRLRVQAAAGSIRAAELLLDRAYGKPHQVSLISAQVKKSESQNDNHAIIEIVQPAEASEIIDVTPEPQNENQA